MNLRGNTLEETITNYNEFKKGLKEQAKCRDFELTLETAITIYREVLITSRLAYFQLKKEGNTNELQRYSERGIRAKTLVGHLLRLREEHRNKRNNTEVSNWFDRARRDSMGTPQERGADHRGENITG